MRRTNKLLIAVLVIALTVTMSLPCFSFGSETYNPTLPSYEQGNGNEGETVDPEQPTAGPTEESEEVQVQEEEEETSSTIEPTTEPDPVWNGANATRIPVITYHRLCSVQEKNMRANKRNSLFISNATFDSQMRWLYNRGYRTISTEEFYKWRIGAIKLPKKSVLITFDDGSYSVIKYALPILQKYHMKGTVFVIGQNTRAGTNRAAQKNGRYCCLGEDVINEVKASYPRLEFQSHTYNMHRKIKRKAAAVRLSTGQQQADLTAMFNRFGYTVLAYPYGKYSNKTIAAARASHVKMAFTYGSNAYATKKQNIYKIKRIKISGTQSMKKFYRWFK